jgi:Mg-chelatase subunit ChlD
MNFEVSSFLVENKEVKGLKIIGDSIQNRNNTHTIVLLDVSGSMNEDSKLNNVKKSLHFLIKFLQKTDHISLVTFNSNSNIIIENMKVSNDYIETFKYAIDIINANGGTNLSSGLLNVKGLIERAKEVNQNISKTGLIILTDGYTNEGITKSEDIIRLIESLKNVDSTLSITTIGYSDGHNANLLKDIATNGGGSYNIVNNQEQVASVFGDILGGLMTTIAQNVVVKYPSSWNCINIYTKKENNNIISLNIGDVNAESETIILFENADNSSIIIEGFSTKDFTQITKTIEWTNLSTNKVSYVVSYICNAIAYILSNMNNIIMIRPKVLIIKAYLSEPSIQSHPLIPFLLQEMVSIERQLEGANTNQTMNLQTSALLALGRGVSQYQTPPPIQRRRGVRRLSFDEDILVNNLNNITIQTPFSNRFQQELTEQMVNMTQDPSMN